MRSRKHAQTRPSPVPVALLLIDVLTTFDFPDGDKILEGALKMRDPLVRLKARARHSCARNADEHAQALAQLKAMAGANLTHSTSLKLPSVIRAAQRSQRSGR